MITMHKWGELLLVRPVKAADSLRSEHISCSPNVHKAFYVRLKCNLKDVIICKKFLYTCAPYSLSWELGTPVLCIVSQQHAMHRARLCT